jgi:glycosyltransferase involved in cell wall biosynthesis
MPCYNEELFILKALEQLVGQYEPDRFEIIVVDGMSEDHSRDLIRDFHSQHPELSLTVIQNQARNIPTGLNLGIAAASGEFIARMDAHAAPSAGYIRRCLEVLRQENTGVVGMPCYVRPGNNTVVARAIASAVSHPFGIGDAKYRLGAGTALQEPVDTVAFACFRKSLWQELAGFNESLLTNEDYDFNYRVRLTGRKVILDRSGHCNYFARTSLGGLAAQYSRYGGWKARMIRLHPRSIKLRHLVAPAFVLSIAALLLLSIFRPFFAALLGLEFGLYFFLALVFAWSIKQRNHESVRMMLVLPLVFLVIHLTWGASFLLGLVHKPR